ncbi:hypothetical protein [Micromonospora sp. CV4]|uniref:hypothetical protein n=1 Tax=Micromonospora sp. CV4 TaxID=2478711 RepID=UPI0011C3C27E|nr:hypothetical protein [Micromonospora sp. CV4]
MKATIRSDFQRRVRRTVPSIDDNEDPSRNKTEYSDRRIGTPSPAGRREVERKSLAHQGISLVTARISPRADPGKGRPATARRPVDSNSPEHLTFWAARFFHCGNDQ